MRADEFRTNGHSLVDWLADYLEGLEERPVSPSVAPGDVRAAVPPRAPDRSEEFGAVLTDLQEVILPGLTHWQHPSFFAYFPANASYSSVLGELACSGLAVNGMSWATSPACTELEQSMCDWMADLLGLPGAFRFEGTGGGVIQDSASSAALCAIVAARHRATKSGARVEDLVAYASQEAHSSVEKGMRVAGLPEGSLRKVPTDPDYSMSFRCLEEMVNSDKSDGLRPFLVFGTVGTTSSMAVDPVAQIGRLARSEGMWLHVDAAMAGTAALCPEHRDLVDGADLADSWCTNPHKWMGVQFDCDLMWVAERSQLTAALSITPEYLRTREGDAGTVVDYRDWQVPLGRRFRSLKLWMTLRLEGVEAIRSMIRRHVAWAGELASWVANDQRFELVAPPRLNLVCLALRAGDEPTDRLVEAANATGDALFTRTVLGGRSALRFCVGGLRTERHHVEKGWELLQGLADSLS